MIRATKHILKNLFRPNHVQVAIVIFSSVVRIGELVLAYGGIGVCSGIQAEKFTCKVTQLELQMNMAFEKFSDLSIEHELGNIGR